MTEIRALRKDHVAVWLIDSKSAVGSKPYSIVCLVRSVDKDRCDVLIRESCGATMTVSAPQKRLRLLSFEMARAAADSGMLPDGTLLRRDDGSCELKLRTFRGND